MHCVGTSSSAAAALQQRDEEGEPEMPKIIGPTKRELQSELRVSRFAWRRSGVLAVACAALALLLAPQRIAAAPSGPTDPGDGRVSSFYTWAGGLPEKPGVVLRTEPLPPELGL